MKYKISTNPLWKRLRKNVLAGEDKISLFIGLLFTILLVTFLFYVISERYHVLKQYYTLDLESDFLEDITPGTKVRFQASLVVGEVVSVRTNLTRHFISIKLKKDFQIPKRGSRISLETWGYFGQKFVNISIASGSENGHYYAKDDVIQMESPIKIDEAMQKFHTLIKKEGKTSTNLLSKKLKDVRSMIRRLSSVPYLRKSITPVVRAEAKQFRDGVENAQKLASDYLKNIEDVNAELLSLSEKFGRQMPLIREKTTSTKDWINYKNRLKSFFTRYIYDETDYYLAKIFMALMKEKSEQYLNDPSILLGSD